MREVKMAYLDRAYLEQKEALDQAWMKTNMVGRYIGGDPVAAFEDVFANYIGAKHVISCDNGTDALLCALIALDMNEGDEIIMPAFGYISAYEMCRLLKLVPVLVDIDQYCHIDTDHISSKINSKTKAIITQHLYGQMSDMDNLMQIAQRHNIPIIEDSAQAIGSSQLTPDGWKHAGTIGTIGTFSFFPTKNLGCFGDGGAIVTDHDDIAQKLRLVSKHGQSAKYRHEIIGLNSRLDSLQANILMTKLPILDKNTSRRKQIALQYDERIIQFPGIKPSTRPNTVHTYHQYCLLTPRRDELKAYLAQHGIESTVYYPKPIHQQPVYNDPTAVDYPNSELVAKRILSIPASPQLTDEEVDYVIEVIQKWSNHE